jgi:hypothetical protein
MLFLQEFEPLIQKPYTIAYFHSAASLQVYELNMLLRWKLHNACLNLGLYGTKIFNEFTGSLT